MEYIIGFLVFIGVPVVGGTLFVRPNGDVSGWLGLGMVLGPLAGIMYHTHFCL